MVKTMLAKGTGDQINYQGGCCRNQWIRRLGPRQDPSLWKKKESEIQCRGEFSQPYLTKDNMRDFKKRQKLNMTPKPWAKKISVLTWLILGGYHEILEKMS